MQLRTVDEAFDLVATRGDGAYGLAGVTQLEHALQSAHLAAQEGRGDELTIAALLHDIGHFAIDPVIDLASEGVDDLHEVSGASLLADLFGPDVAEPVCLHVPAKRWLCATEPDYYAKLAADSVRSFKLQGGPMTVDEARTFAGQPYAAAGILLRRIDDQAKEPGLKTPDLSAYRDMAATLAR